MYLLICLISWLILGWLASRMAQRRGRNPAIWFTLGVILGVIALIILYFLPQKTPLAATAAAPSPQVASEALPSSAQASAHQPPEKLWYYLDKEKKQYGPMSFYALQGAWDDDQIIASTYVWNEDMKNWRTLEDLPDLLARIRRA